MPYTKSNVESKVPGTKNLTDKQKEVFVAVANKEIKDGSSDEDAIKIAYAAAKKSKIRKAMEAFLDSIVGELDDQSAGIEVRKALDKELKQEITVVYLPDTEDAHGEWMSKATVSKLRDDLYKGFIEDKTLFLNLWHDPDLILPKDEADVIDVSLTKSEMYVDDFYIPEGTCIATVQYYNDRLWEMRKAGVIGGLSIHGVRDLFPSEGEDE